MFQKELDLLKSASYEEVRHKPRRRVVKFPRFHLSSFSCYSLILILFSNLISHLDQFLKTNDIFLTHDPDRVVVCLFLQLLNTWLVASFWGNEGRSSTFQLVQQQVKMGGETGGEGWRRRRERGGWWRRRRSQWWRWGGGGSRLWAQLGGSRESRQWPGWRSWWEHNCLFHNLFRNLFHTLFFTLFDIFLLSFVPLFCNVY